MVRPHTDRLLSSRQERRLLKKHLERTETLENTLRSFLAVALLLTAVHCCSCDEKKFGQCVSSNNKIVAVFVGSYAANEAKKVRWYGQCLKGYLIYARFHLQKKALLKAMTRRRYKRIPCKSVAKELRKRNIVAHPKWWTPKPTRKTKLCWLSTSSNSWSSHAEHILVYRMEDSTVFVVGLGN